jgi:hypothetical protein
VGDPTTAVDFDESPEGHALRFDAQRRLVGLTLVRPRHLLDRGHPIVVTVPRPEPVTIDAATLSRVLTAA